MKRRLTLVMIAMIAICLGASSSLAQVGDEKDPDLRFELLRLVKDDQDIRGKFNGFRRERGLFGIDNKTLNEKLNNDPELKKEFLALANRCGCLADRNTCRQRRDFSEVGAGSDEETATV